MRQPIVQSNLIPFIVFVVTAIIIYINWDDKESNVVNVLVTADCVKSVELKFESTKNVTLNFIEIDNKYLDSIMFPETLAKISSAKYSRDELLGYIKEALAECSQDSISDALLDKKGLR